MQVIHPKGSVDRQSAPLLPTELVLLLKQRPKRSSLAVLQDDGEMGRFRACSQKHDYIGMPESLHSMTLAHEISDGVLVVSLDLEYLDCYRTLPPRSFVYNTVSSLRNLLAKLELLERNL